MTHYAYIFKPFCTKLASFWEQWQFRDRWRQCLNKSYWTKCNANKHCWSHSWISLHSVKTERVGYKGSTLTSNLHLGPAESQQWCPKPLVMWPGSSLHWVCLYILHGQYDSDSCSKGDADSEIKLYWKHRRLCQTCFKKSTGLYRWYAKWHMAVRRVTEKMEEVVCDTLDLAWMTASDIDA